MKRINFDIKYRPEIESGKYKVVTRDGRDVRIICWDKKGKYPVVAIVKYYCGEEECFSFTNTGSYSSGTESDYDFFILTDEPELTPFEQAIEDIYESCGVKELRSKDKAKELLDLARKEILKDMPKWRKISEPTYFDGRNRYSLVGSYHIQEERVTKTYLYDSMTGCEIKIEDLMNLPEED